METKTLLIDGGGEHPGIAPLLLNMLPFARSAQDAELIEKYVLLAWLETGNAEARKHFRCGLTSLDENEVAEAQAHFTAAIGADAGYTPAYFKRAECHECLKEHDAALADAHEVVELEPRHFAGWQLLEQLLLKADRQAEADAAHEKVLQVHPWSQALVNTSSSSTASELW